MVVKVVKILKKLLNSLRSSIGLLKVNISIAWSYTKVYPHSLIAHTFRITLEYLGVIFTVMLSDKIGLLKPLGISVKDMILSFLFVTILLYIIAINDWKPNLCEKIEEGSFSDYLIRPKHPLLLDAFLNPEGYWLQSFLNALLLLGITLIYYRISLINIIKTFFVFLIVLIFVFSIAIFSRSLDLIRKGLTNTYYNVEASFINNLEAYPPKYYEKLNKFLFYPLFLLSIYFPVFFTIIPALNKGTILFNHLFAYLILSATLLFLSKKIWDFGIKKYEGYL